LGRGGSDLSASLIGAALGADRIEIWTDVDGMMTADPRVCSDACNIDSISYEEAAELAHFGAKVLHPRTVQPAVSVGIPLYVLNSQQAEQLGTRVEATVPSGAPRVRSIASKRGITLAEVFAKDGLSLNLTNSLFATLHERDCLVDLGAISRSSIALLLNSEAAAAALADSLAGLAEVKVSPGVALVSLIGRNIARDPAILAQVAGVLPDLTIKMIFHGASDLNLTFVVSDCEADRVVRAMHRALFRPSQCDTEPALVLPLSPPFHQSHNSIEA
jgi:aspartate kinase